MNKHRLILVSAIAVAIFLCGCQNAAPKKVQQTAHEKSASQAAPNKVKTVTHEIQTLDSVTAPNEKVYTRKTAVAYCEYSKTLKELFDKSCFVAEIQVGKTYAEIDQIGDITTVFKPIVVNAFKGSYNGQKIRVYGGIADFNDYKEKAPEMLEGVKPVEKVQEIFGKSPLVCEGDSLIVFCRGKDDGLAITYIYEGLFEVDGDTVKNESIKGTKLYKDILKETGDPSATKISKSAFIYKLNQM